MTLRKNTLFLIIHCSATRADQAVTAEDITRWHTQERGFKDIGYHWIIERDGTLKQGRALNEWGAHCKGYNDKSIGICLVGGLDHKNRPDPNYTKRQMTVLKMLVAGHRAIYPGIEIRGHNHFNPNKACPCFNVEIWLANDLPQGIAR